MIYHDILSFEIFYYLVTKKVCPMSKQLHSLITILALVVVSFSIRSLHYVCKDHDLKRRSIAIDYVSVTKVDNDISKLIKTPTKKPVTKPPLLNYNCTKTKIPSKKHHKLTALTSFMGSGNTWVRKLLQDAFGYWTGSIYPDNDIKKYNLVPDFGKINCNHQKGKSEFIVVKTHRWPSWGEQPSKGSAAPCTFERAILIIRNLFEALPSEFQRQEAEQKKKELAKSEREDFNPHTVKMTKDDILRHYRWPKFVKNMAEHWLTLITEWAEYEKALSLFAVNFELSSFSLSPVIVMIRSRQLQ